MVALQEEHAALFEPSECEICKGAKVDTQYKVLEATHPACLLVSLSLLFSPSPSLLSLLPQCLHVAVQTSFGVQVCFDCRRADTTGNYKLLPRTTAKTDFLLADKDLDGAILCSLSVTHAG
jgi:hypothetical protein